MGSSVSLTLSLCLSLYFSLSTGKKIDCLVDKAYDSYSDKTFKPFNDAVNHYCFITGVFTVERPANSTSFPHPGIGPVEPGDSVTVHSYYQWVPFVMFLQV